MILDGVNFDFEEELEVGSEESRAYTKILKETARVFHQRIPDSQVDKYKTIRTLLARTKSAIPKCLT